MPLPNITPRRGWKSCNALPNQNSPSNAKLRVPHYKSSSCKKKKKIKPLYLDTSNTEKRDSNRNLWKKLAKVQKLDLQQNLSRKNYNKTASAIMYTNNDKTHILPTEQRGP